MPGNLHRIYLSSPGGNVLEAMTMGRMLRIARVSTEAGCRGNTVCCASACALIYYGGAAWRPLDRLGWHRPSREDALDIEYMDSKSSMVIVHALIKTYFADMEIPTPIYDEMMRTPPDLIAIVQVVNEPRYEQHVAFPPSINDWLLAKCQNKQPDTLFMCMNHELRTPDSVSNDEVTQYVWFADKNAEQLRALLEYSRPIPFGKYRRTAAKHELERRTNAGKQGMSRP